MGRKAGRVATTPTPSVISGASRVTTPNGAIGGAATQLKRVREKHRRQKPAIQRYSDGRRTMDFSEVIRKVRTSSRRSSRVKGGSARIGLRRRERQIPTTSKGVLAFSAPLCPRNEWLPIILLPTLPPTRRGKTKKPAGELAL